MHQTDTPDIYTEAVREDEPGSLRRLVGNQLEPAQVDALVEQLQKELGRTIARVQINQGGPEAVLARLVQDAGRRKRAPFVLAGLFLAEFAALISLYLICAMRGIRMTGIDVIMCIFLCVGLVLFCAMARAVLMPRKPRWRRVKSEDVVANYDDLRVIGHLAEALLVRDRDVAEQAELELTLLLPRLSDGNASHLSADQRQCIYRSMSVRNINSKSSFMLEALGAVERIGDTRALPEVLALASCEVSTDSGRKVKLAAESCLQVLRQTDSEREARRLLLRAASADCMSGDELLRPTNHANADSPDELLRAQLND